MCIKPKKKGERRAPVEELKYETVDITLNKIIGIIYSMKKKGAIYNVELMHGLLILIHYNHKYE
jgi:hypothetical protein